MATRIASHRPERVIALCVKRCNGLACPTAILQRQSFDETLHCGLYCPLNSTLFAPHKNEKRDPRHPLIIPRAIPGRSHAALPPLRIASLSMQRGARGSDCSRSPATGRGIASTLSSVQDGDIRVSKFIVHGESRLGVLQSGRDRPRATLNGERPAAHGMLPTAATYDDPIDVLQ